MSIQQIKAEVARLYGLDLADLDGPSQAHRIAHPRQEAMWRARQVKGADGKARYSFPYIASRFGNRDHTTAIHAVRAHERRSLGNPKDEGRRG